MIIIVGIIIIEILYLNQWSLYESYILMTTESDNITETTPIGELTSKNKRLEDEIKKLNRRLQMAQRQNVIYEQQQRRQQNKQQPLNERRQLDEQRQLEAQRQLEEQRQLDEQRQLEEQRNEQLQRDNHEEPNRLIVDPIDIGGGIQVPELSYREAFNCYNPSKFVRIMSYAIWTHLAFKIVFPNFSFKIS
ncbi:putative uncharacterized protein DDB_G0271606 [Microplitis demolitor]|uniref:putative uncharacterized protein DDB_G0271606 n=1 Tax=Microplitis demolitor TaxID=69319 RepID=UPI0006D4DB28|nr:putative uncharacterized protein DDB_G0271606 [Microplitis demolitor]